MKLRAAQAALSWLPERGTIGLGSGSTASLFIEQFAGWSRGKRFLGVPTSRASRELAERLGVQLLGDEGPWAIDVTVDGADEVDADLHLIKGGGGCHTREKIINAASNKNVIVVDESKLSERVGQKRLLPIEVLSFGHLATVAKLGQYGSVQLRMAGSHPFLTDSGNLIYDLATGAIGDPPALERSLKAIPGVVEIGLFISRADVVVVASADGVRLLERDRLRG